MLLDMSSGDIRGWKAVRRHKELLFMLAPILLFFIIFNYIPMYGIVIAFKNYRISEGIFGSEWVGLYHFKKLFLSREFLDALRNTITISLLRFWLGFFAPIVVALLLNELRIAWYKKAVQTATYMPYFFSWVVLGGIFLMIFGNAGSANQLVASLAGLWNGLVARANEAWGWHLTWVMPRKINFLTNDA